MELQFVKGGAYEAIPALRGNRRRLVVCVGRGGGKVEFAWAEDLTVETSEVCIGREFVRTNRPDGVYVVSSAVPIDVQAAASVIDFVRPQRKAV